jgi:hypothetical protein
MSDPTIVLTATDNASRVLAGVRGQIDKLNLVGAKLGNVLGSIGVGLSAGALAGLVKGINDGVDALNDLKDASGASIENISALEDVAARTGTSFDTVGAALIKFNGILKDARPGSQAEAALNALNLSVKELQQLDPAEALRQTAVALAGFADDANKARLTQELFGKSLRAVAPFLTDLAKQGELVATVTSRQAEEAEKFNLELFRLGKNAEDAKRALVGPLVEGLNQVIKAFREGSKQGDGFFATLFRNSEIGNLGRFVRTTTGIGQANPVPKFLLDYNESDAERMRLARQSERRSVGALPDAASRGTSRVVRTAQDSLQPATTDLDRYLESLTRTLEAQQELTAVQTAQARISEAGAQGFSEAQRTRILAIAAEIDKQKELKSILEQANVEQEERIRIGRQAAIDQGVDNSERSDRLKSLLSNTDEERFSRIREDVALLAEEFTAGRLAGGVEQYIQAVQNAVGQTGEAVEKTKSAVDELNLSFASAFEDAIVGGKSFQDVLKGIGQDILRLSIRRAITEPLGGFLTSALGGLLSFDGGGYTGSGARAGGLDGKGGFLSLLHPRETVIDHTKGGTAGGTVNLYLTQNNGALVTPQELARNNEQLVRQIQGGLLRSQQYGGALA